MSKSAVVVFAKELVAGSWKNKLSQGRVSSIIFGGE